MIKQVIGAIGQGTTKAVTTLNLDKVLGSEAVSGVKGAVEKGAEGVGGTLKNLFNK